MKTRLIYLITLLLSFSATAQSTDSYKSLLLYKFAEYINWPNSDGEVKVGSVGNSAIYTKLAAFAAKREHMSVVSIAHAGELSDCDMVFLSDGYGDQLKYFRAKIQYNSVLVVSENKDDILRGADIVMFEEGGKMKFILNERTIQDKGLIASKRLSTLAYSM